MQNVRRYEGKALAQSAHLLSTREKSNRAVGTTLAKFSSTSGCFESKIEQAKRDDDLLCEGYSGLERVREFRREREVVK